MGSGTTALTAVGWVVCAACPVAQAQAPAANLPEVLIQGLAEEDPSALAFGRVSSSDTAALLPGVSPAQNGGVSSLPVIHGLGDDRVRTLVNGVPVTAACPMHMNPPLSYIDPSNVTSIEVLPGVTPVSFGGDSIAGTVKVDSPTPAFAAGEQALEHQGALSSFLRSNGSQVGGASNVSVASHTLAISYAGSGGRSGDNHDGLGEQIRASGFEASDQQLSAAYRNGVSLYEAQASLQYMPYEGFPNGDMDLTDNVAGFVTLRYRTTLGWGDLDANGYYDHIAHAMNGNAPDRYLPIPVSITSMGLMPTRERSQEFGYRVALSLGRSADDRVRIGNELHGQALDDRWPGAPIGMMFDYVSINHGTRIQVGTFGEWERHWNARWSTLLGVRNDTVFMDTGPVQGYDGLDASASAFNAEHRARTDMNFDATLLARFTPDRSQTYAFGLGRKNRSPNLYERYAWGTSTVGMVTWFGDGNGYTGRPDVKPETAYTASLSAKWHGTASAPWELDLTPYYTTIDNYIGVIPLCFAGCPATPGRQLEFENQNARLWGIDGSANYTFATSAVVGELRLSATASYTRGEDYSTRSNLYHIMPLNGTVALEQQRGVWLSRMELRAVARKDDVDAIRLEPETPGYLIVDLRGAHLWRSVRLDLAVTNLFNRQYENPLAGSWQSALYPPGYAGMTFQPLPAPGRSVDLGITFQL